MSEEAPQDRSFFISHPRRYAANKYVYPVLSRRAGGISIGVNLNPDKTCNFNCIYCQVSRFDRQQSAPIDIERLSEEVDDAIEQVISGKLFEGERFCYAPVRLRRLNDIAFSGDGEPTACPEFKEAVEACAEIRQRRMLNNVKLVLITNATLLHHPQVIEALAILDANNGEIWAKLDAGTESYYRLVNRSPVPWQRILENLRNTARLRPIVIQTLFSRIHDQPPPKEEIQAYCDRLKEIVRHGGEIKLVQIHTIARKPAEAWVSPLMNSEVDEIAELVQHCTGLPVAAFYGTPQ